MNEVDPRPRRLLERYLMLVGGVFAERSPELADIALPDMERSFFGGAGKLSVAFTPDGLEQDPTAEILVNGSDFLRRLIGAVQARGASNMRGRITPTLALTNQASGLPVALHNAHVSHTNANTTYRPVGQLLARVSIHAGPSLTERLIETPVVDLANGQAVPIALRDFLASRQEHASPERYPEEQTFVMGDVASLMRMLLDHIGQGVAGDVARIRGEASDALVSELTRLGAYYDSMISEVEIGVGDPGDARERKAAIRADRDRRRLEEEHRHTVRVTVHPVQLTHWMVPAEEVEWRVETASGRNGSVSSARLLVGDGSWALTCPACGGSPSAVLLCRHNHVCCSHCAHDCTVCDEACCAMHGRGMCEIGAHALCSEHMKVCPGCDRAHCGDHAGHCDLFDHSICGTCAVACARCSTAMCKGHATETAETAPLGRRWLCPACTVSCEGGQDEPVGLDEVVRCASCAASICTIHQAWCVVDGQAHCSRHLRRSDRSGRLVCEAHRESCAEEPHSVLATDELSGCGTCGRRICSDHGKTCAVDGLVHCMSHLKPAASERQTLLCETHRAECHVDGRVHRLEQVSSCPVCSFSVCESHVSECGHCGRTACASDVISGRCRTCARLATNWEPDDELMACAIVANGGEAIGKGTWRTARDSQHTVVEIERGWTRRLVFAVRHGDTSPDTIFRHSALGARREK